MRVVEKACAGSGIIVSFPDLFDPEVEEALVTSPSQAPLLPDHVKG